MLAIGALFVSVLVQSVAGGDFPDFDDDDETDEYYVCEGDACIQRTFHLHFNRNVQVPNKSVTYEVRKHFDVDQVGLLADCAPSLSIRQIATTIKSCKVIDWKYRKACEFRKKEWIGEDGKTVNTSLATEFDELDGVSENIAKCLDWDGDYDYQYEYYDYDYDWYDYYDYYRLEEQDNSNVIVKRNIKSNVPQFLVQKTRNKREVNKKGNKGKKQGGNKTGKKGKETKRNKEKGNNKKGKGNNKKGKSNNKKGKRNNKKVKSNNKKGNRKNKKGNRNNKKKNNKKKKDKKKKEEERKKKKETKTLQLIGLDTNPSKEIINQLDCVERAIQFGLEKCGEKIFGNLDQR